MCGICACIGKDNVLNKVINGLRKLEYRGYDSSGLAFFVNKKINVIKKTGKIDNLIKSLPEKTSSNIAISHCRWATHGKVSEENAHPQCSVDGKFVIVHNGIIENYLELKAKFFPQIKLTSETDTEIFANLLSHFKGNLIEKISKTMNVVEGSFAVAIMVEGRNEIYVARHGSPMLIAKNDKFCLAGSDMSVFDRSFDMCFFLADDEIAQLNSNEIVFYNKNGEKIFKKQEKIEIYDDYEDFFNEKPKMLKEIKEQPFVLKKTFFKWFNESVLSEQQTKQLRKYKAFHFVACGTAYHSALLGARYIEKFFRKKTYVSLASEFRYADNVLSKDCLYVFISQSGETADTISCAKFIKEKNLATMVITNVPYCSLNKFADFVVPTFAGREMAVASTKAYTAQVFTMLILSIILSNRQNLKSKIKQFSLFFEVSNIDKNHINAIRGFEKILFTGRGYDYVTSLEANLKLKEIAYLNCSSVAMGELKHGTLALVDERTLVIVISTQRKLKEKVENNIQEIQARGGKIFLVSNLNHNISVDYKIDLPDFSAELMPIISIVPLQLLALGVAQDLGCNPDMPRNLAKSVTVE